MADIEDLDKSGWDSLSSSEKTDIREDVENLSSTGFKQLSDDKKNWLIREAIGEASTLYTGKYSRLPTVDGDHETFRLALAAHKWTQAEGGEALPSRPT